MVKQDMEEQVHDKGIQEHIDSQVSALNLNVTSLPVLERIHDNAEAKIIQRQNETILSESQTCVVEPKNIVGYMNHKRYSYETNLYMLYDDRMEDSVDQLLRFIETSKDVPGCLPSSQYVKEREILNLTRINGTCVLPHDNLHMLVDLNPSESMILENNEIFCGFPRISTVVMSRSHSSTFRLNSDAIINDYVRLSSSIYPTIPCIDDEYIEDVKAKIMVIPRDRYPLSFPLMDPYDSYFEILEPCFSEISIKTQDAHDESKKKGNVEDVSTPTYVHKGLTMEGVTEDLTPT